MVADTAAMPAAPHLSTKPSAALTAPGTPHPWSRIDGIDLLRGLSILLVLMNHINMQLLFAHVPYTRGLPPQLAASLVWNGQQGVQIFFVVSGFLITSTSILRWGTPAALSIREFYLLRCARIAPLLLALLVILSGLHLFHVHNFVISRKAGGLPAALFAALTFHINYLEATRTYLPGSWDILWSLSVEETFYLAFPLVARLLPHRRLLLALLALFLIAGPLTRAHAFTHNEVWYEYSYLGGMDAIALGCLTAILLSSNPLGRTPRRLLGSIGALLLFFSLGDSLQLEKWGLHRNGLSMTVVALGAALLSAAAAASRWQAPRLLTPVRILGQRSYEVYLTHMFVVIAVFALYKQHGKPLALVPVLFMLILTLAGALGYLVATRYAEPANLHLRRAFRIGPSTLPSAQPAVD